MIETPLRISPKSGAVLFDLDGTLADTDPIHAKAWQSVAERRFGIVFTWDEYYKACILDGNSPAEFLRRQGVDVSSSEVAEAKATVFRQLILQGLDLAPGAARLIASLDEMNVPLAVVSSGSRRSVDAFVDSLWPGRMPPVVTVSREDTRSHKPEPEPYALALKRLGKIPSSCIAIEDTGRGILAAHRAGLLTILVAGTGVSSEFADMTVVDLEQLNTAMDDEGGVLLVANKQWRLK